MGDESPTRWVGGSPSALAAAPRGSRSGALSLALATALLLIAGPSMAESAPVAAPAPTRILILDDVQADLGVLLTVPPAAVRPTPSELVDARIAAAVAKGSNDDLLPRSGFRKRSVDLFRAERPVEIADQEMVLRLRLRAKRREAMRVELRF